MLGFMLIQLASLKVGSMRTGYTASASFTSTTNLVAAGVLACEFGRRLVARSGTGRGRPVHSQPGRLRYVCPPSHRRSHDAEAVVHRVGDSRTQPQAFARGLTFKPLENAAQPRAIRRGTDGQPVALVIRACLRA